MKPLNPPPTLPALVRWPAVCLLLLVWAPMALIGVIGGGIGTGARSVASWAMNRLEDLNS